MAGVGCVFPPTGDAKPRAPGGGAGCGAGCGGGSRIYFLMGCF
nr:hypothetical protein RVX_0623 [Nitratidesulfovibrio sp. HK-II]